MKSSFNTIYWKFSAVFFFFLKKLIATFVAAISVNSVFLVIQELVKNLF